MKQFSSLIIRLQDVHEAVCGLKYINSAIHPPTQCSTVESCHSGKLIVSHARILGSARWQFTDSNYVLQTNCLKTLHEG